jgi:hypothetical protein
MMKKIALLVRDYALMVLFFAAAYEVVYYGWHGRFPPFWD